MHWIIWSLMALYTVLALGVLLRARQQRRVAARLLWPASTTQWQMERWGVRYLEAKGWDASTIVTQATVSVIQCRKEADEMYLVFLRDSAFFRRLMVIVGRLGVWMMPRMVVVLYDPPSDAMRLLAAEQKIALADFRELPLFNTHEEARKPGLAAVREIRQRIKAV